MNKKAQQTDKLSCGFYIGLGSESEWESNAEEDGWNFQDVDTDVFTAMAQKVENNVLAWLNSNVGRARAEGHNSYDELAGTIWVDKGSDGYELIKSVIDDGEPLSTGKGNLSDLEMLDGVEDKFARLFNVSLDFQADYDDAGWKGEEEID